MSLDLFVSEGLKQLKIIKSATFSTFKSQARSIITGEGDVSPADLLDPAKYIIDSRLKTLFGEKSKTEQTPYFTPFGAAATDYIVYKCIMFSLF